MKRTFIAFKTPLDRYAIEFVNDIKLNLRNEKIKWIESFNMHISLFFLGDTDENAINGICELLPDSLKEIHPFEINCKGIGVFKNIKDPKVIWLGIEYPQALKMLKHAVDGVVKGFGFEIDERDFMPHLTLGRIKFIKDKNILNPILMKYKSTDFQRMLIDEVILYESTLTTQGSIYKAIKKFRLD